MANPRARAKHIRDAAARPVVGGAIGAAVGSLAPTFDALRVSQETVLVALGTVALVTAVAIALDRLGPQSRSWIRSDGLASTSRCSSGACLRPRSARPVVQGREPVGIGRQGAQSPHGSPSSDPRQVLCSPRLRCRRDEIGTPRDRRRPNAGTDRRRPRTTAVRVACLRRRMDRHSPATMRAISRYLPRLRERDLVPSQPLAEPTVWVVAHDASEPKPQGKHQRQAHDIRRVDPPRCRSGRRA